MIATTSVPLALGVALLESCAHGDAPEASVLLSRLVKAKGLVLSRPEYDATAPIIVALPLLLTESVVSEPVASTLIAQAKQQPSIDVVSLPFSTNPLGQVNVWLTFVSVMTTMMSVSWAAGATVTTIGCATASFFHELLKATYFAPALGGFKAPLKIQLEPRTGSCPTRWRIVPQPQPQV